jgi:hypothetical protein
MKYFILLITMILPLTFISGQKIGELAPEKPPAEFPSNSWGMDIMFGEGGFGLGTFLRHRFNSSLTGFADISLSESKDDREVEFIDYFGQSFTRGKVNRVFIVPINFGLQYRLFASQITDNLRPYINGGVGPTLVLTTPYAKEFFKAFGDVKTKFAAGGYVGFGANFGLSKSNLLGINVRYYVIHMFDEGVENLEGRFRKDFGHFYLTINLGIMY